MTVLVNEGIQAILLSLAGQGAGLPVLDRRLFTDSSPITNTSTLAGKTECSLTGYSRRPLTDLTTLTGPSSGDASLSAAGALLTFAAYGGAPVTIYSWGVVDATSSKLVYGDMLPAAFTVPNAGGLFLGSDTIALGPHA